MPAVTLWLFIAGGIALAARAKVTGSVIAGPRNRTALALGWLVLAVAPLLVGLSYQRLQASGQALNASDCASSRQRALSSLSLLAVRPEAYALIGFCDLQQGFPAEALTSMEKSVFYEKHDWNYRYGLAVARAANGLDPRAAAEQALMLNPHEAIILDAVRAFQKPGARNWERASGAALLEGLQSGRLAISNL